MLESLCVRGVFKEAKIVYVNLMIYYAGFLKQNENVSEQ